LREANILAIKVGYRAQAEDTSIETDVFEFGLLRERSDFDRLQMAMACTRGARKLSLCGLRQTFSALSPEFFAQKVARAFLGDDYPANFIPCGTEMTWIQDSTSLAIQLHDVFERLDILYYVTGGIASVYYGEPRSTRDLDVVLNIDIDGIDTLVAALESENFYVPGVEEVKSGRMQTLGITHKETISRADLVISGKDEFDLLKFERRKSIEFSTEINVYLASPEDVILNKLRWGAKSQSEKQWRDVLGVLKVRGENLDFNYLRHWAERLGLEDLLEQAFTEAGI
jgi:hypothetical protein